MTTLATETVINPTHGFHVMTKPIGPICNLDCSYCFYLEKEHLFPKNERFQMSDEVLEAYIRDYLSSQPGPKVTFAWQGGEPLLLGLDLAAPPDGEVSESPVTERSVDPHDFGEFLVTIFDEWVRQDVGKISIGLFDDSLGKWAGAEGGMCVFSETCGVAMAMEHNGDLYSCDHYVYPEA